MKFNGVTAMPATWSATQVTVPVPSGATTGSVVVHTSGVDTNGANFTAATVTAIALTPQNLSLPLNSLQHLVATATYSNGSTDSLGSNAMWSSSDSSVGTIATTGLLTAVGKGQATIQAAFGSVVGSATFAITGPRFFPSGYLGIPRSYHTATLLNSGKVLIVGGQSLTNGLRELASAELYDPATRAFTPTGRLRTARKDHTATLLQNGMVLIAGGNVYVPGFDATNTLATAELYDPATGTFTSTAGNMNNPHETHTATALNSGMVLIAGGLHQTPDLVSGYSIAELFDPTSQGFTPTGSQMKDRTQHTATRLADGTVLLAGGGRPEINSAEVFDPATGTFASTGSLKSPVSYHTATLLRSGMVLIAGGYCDCAAEAELYDPVARAFTMTGNLNIGRMQHTATLLNDGTVLIAGGIADDITGAAEVFDPSTQTFVGDGSLTDPRIGHTATLLNDGTVLIVGGYGSHGESERAEIYSRHRRHLTPYKLRRQPSTCRLGTPDNSRRSTVSAILDLTRHGRSATPVWQPSQRMVNPCSQPLPLVRSRSLPAWKASPRRS